MNSPMADIRRPAAQSAPLLALDGCTATPLGSYLKSLGIFRLIAEQKDPDVRAWWQEDRLMLRTGFADEIEHFFLYEYEPTPILSPWNSRTGFLEGERGGIVSTRMGARILRKLDDATAARFRPYKTLVQRARDDATLRTWDLIVAERKKLKEKLDEKGLSREEKAALRARDRELAARAAPLKELSLASLRAHLPDRAVDWIDACFAIAEDVRTAALLGTGGNEGSMDFSINHLNTLLKMFDPESGKPAAGVDAALAGALFGSPVQQWRGVNPGLLAPASLGGVNMSSARSARVFENPWDAVFMLEGALLFSATVTRRHGASPGGGLSFPFALAAVNAGHGGVSPTETSRPEIWAPLWEAPATADEVEALFAEGRLTLGRRPARSALDGARAVSKLGADRGVAAFQRFGFYERRGQGYYVTVPLERRRVGDNPAARLVDQLEHNFWLSRFRRLPSARGAPSRLIELVRRLEDDLFHLTGTRSQQKDPYAVQALLGTLGEAQRYLAVSPQARQQCPPLPPLGLDWIGAADDRSLEYHFALALAGLHGFAPAFGGKTRPTFPMAVHFAPLNMSFGDAADDGDVDAERVAASSAAASHKEDASDGASAGDAGDAPPGKGEHRLGWRPMWDETSRAYNRVVWGPGPLAANLSALLHRRTVETDRLGLVDKPFASNRQLPLSAVAAWLHGDMDENKVARLLPALSLLPSRAWASTPLRGERGATGRLPFVYVALKPLFCPQAQLRRTKIIPQDGTLPLPPQVVQHLLAGRLDDALRHGLRRLRIVGLGARVPARTAGSVDVMRLIGALLAPITDKGLLALARRLGFKDDEKSKE